MKTICKKTIVISIILLLIGVSVSSATTNVVIKSLINDNQPPTPPDICGPSEIPIGEYITFSFNSVDPDEDNVSYFIECDDGTSYGWTGYYTSGQDIEVAFMWEEKPLYIKAKAKDYPYEAESNWTYKYFRGRSRNLESNYKEDCGCQEVSKSDLVKVERLLDRIEVYSKLLLVLSRYNPELRVDYEELTDMILTLNKRNDDRLICMILESILRIAEERYDYYFEKIVDSLYKHKDYLLLIYGIPFMIYSTVIYGTMYIMLKLNCDNLP